MITVGLTGSIGMGKSTVAKMFADLGAYVWDADSAVHRLYARGGAAVALIDRRFPGVVENGAVMRDRLANEVLGDPEAMTDLETIVHPLVAADRMVFIQEARRAGAKMAVLDIPLLFETGAEAAFDATVVVSAPPDVQRARVLSRPGMTAEKFQAILAKQLPDEEKRLRADYVIETNGPMEQTRARVAVVYGQLYRRIARLH